MYTVENFKTKSALKEAVKNGERVKIYQPGGFFPDPDFSVKKRHTVEGPHYPQAHTWYAEVNTDDDGYVLSVK